MPGLKRAIPEVKKTIKAFLVEEKGSISKHRVASLGAFLGSVSVLGMLPAVQAGHSNSFTVNWNSGNVTAAHSHHGSHSSCHSSHSSCHSSCHASCHNSGHSSCHSSHSSCHASHSSCHASHSSCHASHDSCHVSCQHDDHNSCGVGMCCLSCCPKSG